MRNHTLISFCLSTLFISACGDAPQESSETATGVSESALQQTTKGTATEPSLMDQSKDLGQEAWEKTKVVTGETLEQVGETSQELYDAAKETAVEVGEAISETSSEVYESTKTITLETYESAKASGAEMLQETTQPAE